MDRVLGYEPRRWIRAEHDLPTADDSHLTADNSHLALYRLLEALAQAIGWLVAVSTGFTRRGLPVSIGSIRLVGPLPVDGTLGLDAEVVAWRDETALISGRASVAGRPVVAIDRGLCAFVPGERLDDPARTRARFALLLATDAPGTAVEDRWPRAAGLERVTLDGGRRARTRWRVGDAEEFFHEHFPRLPLVPGALQVQAMVDLARPLVRGDARRRPRVEELCEVKFRGFVQPGDQVELEAEALSVTAERGVARAEAQVGGKRVASIKEIHFGLDAPPPAG